MEVGLKKIKAFFLQKFIDILTLPYFHIVPRNKSKCLIAKIIIIKDIELLKTVNSLANDTDNTAMFSLRSVSRC